MKKQMYSMFLLSCILMLLLSSFCVSASTSSNIKLGDYVQMGTYYGKPILWRCVAFEKINGYDANGNPIIDSTNTVTEYREGYLPLMLSDKVLCIKPFDASGNSLIGSHNRGWYTNGIRGYYRRIKGSDYWGDSNLRCWLNSTASAGNVTWTCGNPPDESHVYRGYNEYDQEAGFLTNFTQIERNAMKMVNQKSLLHGYEYTDSSNTLNSNYHLNSIYGQSTTQVVQNYATAFSERFTDKVFLLDVKQIDEVYQNSNVLGTNYYIGEPTAECVSNSQYKTSSIAVGKKVKTWLRSICSDNVGCVLRYVETNGEIYTDIAINGDITGVRPAFFLNLPTTSFSSGTGTQNTPYIIGKTISVTKTSGEKVLVTIPGNLTETTQIFLACYQGNKLVEIQPANYSDEPIEFTATKTFDTAKIMMWNTLNNLTPLLSAKEL